MNVTVLKSPNMAGRVRGYQRLLRCEHQRARRQSHAVRRTDEDRRTLLARNPVVQFKRILCPIDLSDLSTRPLAYAAAMASSHDARLTVLHVVPSFEPMEVRAGGLFDPVQLVYPMPREEVIERLRTALDTAGVSAEGVALAAEAGDAAPTIVDQSVATKADLVVLGTHGRTGFNRLLLGSVTEKVLRQAPCPVLTVPPHAPPTGAAIRHVLCAMDFSPGALQALGFALGVAQRAGASVTLLNAIEWLPEEEPADPTTFNVVEYREHLKQAARDRLAALVEKTRGQTTPTLLVVTGRAHREILHLAEARDVDLIVMGATGRGPVLTPFGTTTQQVVRSAGCPVLTVRAPAT
jgi:nucleotide-binding universal stress UspA family protein